VKPLTNLTDAEKEALTSLLYLATHDRQQGSPRELHHRAIRQHRDAARAGLHHRARQPLRQELHVMPLTITDADRSLAAELGLLLVQEPTTDRERQDAADPRATRTPARWTVKIAGTARVVGRLHFTAVDCLYASKLTAGISGIEETVADALRWIVPIVRHARTGAYDGVETIVRRHGSTYDRPRAITACGGKATGADYTPIAAKIAIRDGQAGELCPACRKKLEDRGVRDASNLSARSGSSSPKQRDFLRRLLDEGARCGRPYLLEAREIDQMSSREASRTIDALRALKARDWKGDL
jgi:hypothetical protein